MIMIVTMKHLNISGTSTMQIKKIKQLSIEIFKTVNNLNPDFMKNIFTSKQNARVRSHDLLVRSHNTETLRPKYGMHCLLK